MSVTHAEVTAKANSLMHDVSARAWNRDHTIAGVFAPAPHVLATTGPHTNTLPLIDLEAAARGELIHRGAADWEALAVGVAGQVLTSGGAGANVLWAAAAGGGNLEPFFPVPNPDTKYGAQMLDGVSTLVPIEFIIPSNFDALTSIEAIVLQIDDAGSGNMVWTVATDFGQTCTEDYFQHEDTAGATSQILQDILVCLDISAAFTGLVAGDLVQLDFTRVGGDGSDSLDEPCYLKGVKLVYTT